MAYNDMRQRWTMKLSMALAQKKSMRMVWMEWALIGVVKSVLRIKCIIFEFASIMKHDVSQVLHSSNYISL